MLSDRLKEKTKIAHQDLEKLLIQKIKSIKAADDYINILIHFYIFFGPLEKEIFSLIGSKIPDIHERRKTKSIVDDLRFFGSFPPNIIPNHCIPPIRNYLQAWGAMYVLEGSTLGGKTISKMVSQLLYMDPNRGFTFFTGYGEATTYMWEDFKACLNGQRLTPEEEIEIVNAANKTFLMFKESITTEIN